MADCAGGFGNLNFLVKSAGLSEPVLRLLIGLFSAYPLAFIYRAFFYKANSTLQHLYFTSSGFTVAVFCYGWCAFHSLTCIVITYLLLHIGGPTVLMVLLTFLVNMGYLLTGYVYYASGDYDVNWTTAQCILCLRLISIAWDYYDGKQEQEKLSADFKTTAIPTPPTLLQMMGLCYFYGGFLVGPQFQIKRYLDFVEGRLIDDKDENNSCIFEGLKRMFAGLFYLGLYAGLEPWFSGKYFLSEAYESVSFFRKACYLSCFGKVALMKYLAVWLLSEGSCIISGISYNGKAEDGKLKWDGFRNVKLSLYEFSYTFQYVVDSFNINTNKWVFRYFYKRLRFLGNKTLSHFLTLMFLAVWHGLFIGYFLTFIGEFIVIHMEKQIHTMCYTVTKKPLREMSPLVKFAVISVCFPIRLFGFSYFQVPFEFLTGPRIHKVWSSSSYNILFIVLCWHVFYPILIRPVFEMLTQQEKDKTKKEE